MLLPEYNIHDAAWDERVVSLLLIHTEASVQEMITRPYLFGASFVDVNPFVFVKICNEDINEGFCSNRLIAFRIS